MHIAWIYGAFMLFQAGSVFTFIYLAGVLGERVQYDMRKLLFNHLQDLSLSYYAQNAVGRLIARVTSDTGRVSDLLTWGVVDITWAVMNITTSVIVHGDHQLETGVDRLQHHPGDDLYRHSIP